MIDRFVPSASQRLFRALRLPHKLGLGEALWRSSLEGRGISWVVFDDLAWKLNLANATHRWLVYGEYEEPAIRRLLQKILRADSIIVDSGANIGQMILLYAMIRRSATIHAFEPTPEARTWLQECVDYNRLSTVSLSSSALGESIGSAGFLQHDFDTKEGSQNCIQDGEEAHQVDLTTLDLYAETAGISTVRFWKLDVEGYELPALRGAQSLLQRSAVDYLYVETANAGTAIAAELAGADYLPVTKDLSRVLRDEEVAGNFSNVFISPRVACEERGFRT